LLEIKQRGHRTIETNAMSVEIQDQYSDIQTFRTGALLATNITSM